LKNTGQITATFLDEITWDIGSQNWSEEDWRRDFEAMSFIGIDTVVIIRGGLRNQAVFPSSVVGNTGDADLARLFLDQAEAHDMRLFFGTYDSALWATGGDREIEDEVSLNLRFLDEVISRYGGHPALQGWYITQEVCSNHSGIKTLFRELTHYLKEKTPNLPTMISPFYSGKLVPKENFLPPEQFGDSWRQILDGLTGLIDVVAFQDGTATEDEFPHYLAETKRFTEEFGVELWNNVETFDRNRSYCFPPRDIRTLRKRLEIAEPYVAKHITFEFSHFMSPNSCFPGAANLYRRYCETVLGKKSPL
jgi:hypothetical protein